MSFPLLFADAFRNEEVRQLFAVSIVKRAMITKRAIQKRSHEEQFTKRNEVNSYGKVGRTINMFFFTN